MYYNNLKLLFRNLRRNGLYSGINIVGLAISLAACVFITLWVRDELSYDRFHKDADNIYMTVAHFKSEDLNLSAEVSSGLFAPTAKQDFALVEDYCRLRIWGAGYLKYNDVKSSRLSCYYADPNFFDFFNFPIVKGNKEMPFQNPNDVVIDERLARELFGDEDPIDKIIALDNRRELHVTAVMEEVPSNTYLSRVNLISSYALDTASYYNKILNTWNGCEFLSFLKLKPGTEVKSLAKQVTDKQTTLQGIRSFSLQPLVNMHLYTVDGEPAGIKTVRLFQWIALIILVIACINYVNLITARASKRHREIGLKKIIGAQKTGLFMQLIGEAVILFAIAGIIAVLLNITLMPAYNQLSGKNIVFGLFDGNIWLTYFMMLVAIIGMAGIYPAYLLASFKPTNMLRSVNAKKGTGLFRKVLVVTQFVASVALITGTVALQGQMKYVREKDQGYDREQVFTCSLGAMRRHLNAVKTELQQETSISGVTAAAANIMDLSSTHGFETWEGKTGEGMMMYTQERVDTSYIRVMRLSLVDGTNFTTTPETQYILNESAVKAMGLTDPVGKWVNNTDQKIVGVVKDFHFKSMHQKIEPLVLIYQPRYFGLLYVRTMPGKAQDAVAAVEKIWKQYNPDYTFSYEFLDDSFDRMYKSDIRSGRLFGVFSLIAVLISCLGLFGLVVYTAELKTKEIGIRKVLGASTTDIIGLLSGNFLILIGIAILIAFPLAYYWLDNMLQSFAYRISLGWQMFAVAGSITIALTLLTVGWQAIKAATADPVKSIKTE